MRCSRVLGVGGERFKASYLMKKRKFLKKHLNSFWEKEKQTYGRLRTGTSPLKTHYKIPVCTNTPMCKLYSPALPDSGCGSHWLLSGLVRRFPGCLKLGNNMYSKKSCFQVRDICFPWKQLVILSCKFLDPCRFKVEFMYPNRNVWKAEVPFNGNRSVQVVTVEDWGQAGI